MNIKLILASLVLGSSSIALAAPGVTVTTESYGSPIVRDHRGDADEYTRAPVAQPVAQPVPSGIYRIGWHPGWEGGQPLPPVYRPVTLASGLHLAANSQTQINVGAQLGRFGTLQINATGGRTVVRKVYVQFANGQEQIVRNLNRTLTGNESLTLDLDGGRRALQRVIVYGSLGSQGWRRTGGTFSVTAS
jgi:hypothetical protein